MNSFQNTIQYIEQYGSIEYFLALLFAIGIFYYVIMGIKVPNFKEVKKDKVLDDFSVKDDELNNY